MKKPEHWGGALGGGEAPRAGAGTRASDDGSSDPARPCADGSPKHAQSARGLPTERRDDHVYAALDLGTNNCRLLIARPEQRSRRKTDMLRIVDAFSRIVRLGEGMGASQRICEPAIERTLDALDVCREKMSARGVSRARLIATQACRAAENGAAFVERVRERTGLLLEVIDRETEARLAARGCGSLADPRAESILLFDIGGGSTELVWLTRDARGCQLRHWTSLELGVVSLAERFGGKSVSAAVYEAMIARAFEALASFAERTAAERRCERFHLLGTSGTVTTLAGVHLGLERYDRWRVDGLWLSDEDATRAIDSLRAMDFDQRAANGCIGPQRADLVLAGCAIFEAIRRVFPASRTRIADRGLREGMLLEMMEADGVLAL
ncbi:Exopolyphosphatase [Methylocapsa aurea]